MASFARYTAFSDVMYIGVRVSLFDSTMLDANLL